MRYILFSVSKIIFEPVVGDTFYAIEVKFLKQYTTVHGVKCKWLRKIPKYTNDIIPIV